MLMSLGQFVFESTTLAFDEIQRKRGWNHASHDVLRGRTVQQYIGPGDETISLPCKIYESHGFGQRQSIDDLALMADTGHGYALIDGSGYVYGVYIITDIDETRSILMFNGIPRKVDCTLSLKRVDDDRIDARGRP